jgi:hypothetical protein
VAITSTPGRGGSLLTWLSQFSSTADRTTWICRTIETVDENIRNSQPLEKDWLFGGKTRLNGSSNGRSFFAQVYENARIGSVLWGSGSVDTWPEMVEMSRDRKRLKWHVTGNS